MDENEVRSLVNDWHARAQQEDEHITRFVFLWFCFNAWLAYESDEDTDRAMIDLLARQSAEASQLQAAFHSSMQSTTFVSYLQRLADLSPVVSNGRSRRQYSTNSLEDFPGIVRCVYQVRCNLFHGTKRAGDTRDYELIRICARILEEWVGCLVTGWYDVHEGCERFFRPGYNGNLVPAWLPALDGVVGKLQRGAAIADVGCGHGASTIVMAQAFPASTFVGSDYHEGSIRTARERAGETGVTGRVSF